MRRNGTRAAMASIAASSGAAAASARRIAGRNILGRTLQAGVDEGRGRVGDLRQTALVRVDRGHAMGAEQRDEPGHAEAFVANLDDMTDGATLDAGRQQLQESLEV